MEPLKPIAKRVAAELMAALKAGKLKKIGIDEIREALFAAPDRPARAIDFRTLEEMTTRALVEMV